MGIISGLVSMPWALEELCCEELLGRRDAPYSLLEMLRWKPALPQLRGEYTGTLTLGSTRSLRKLGPSLLLPPH